MFDMFDSTADSVVLFSFGIGTEKMELSVRSPVPLNNDQWHRVEAEKNIKEAVLQLNGQHRMVRPTTLQGHAKPELYSDLYVGKTCVPHMFMVPFGLMRSMLLFFMSSNRNEQACVLHSVYLVFFFLCFKMLCCDHQSLNYKKSFKFLSEFINGCRSSKYKKNVNGPDFDDKFPKG